MGNERVQGRHAVALLKLLARRHGDDHGDGVGISRRRRASAAIRWSAMSPTSIPGRPTSARSWWIPVPARSATARAGSSSSGPGKFRWESAPEGAEPGAQLLVADGRNLWFMDRDLQQATVRPLDQALPQSPALLLAGWHRPFDRLRAARTCPA